MSAPKRRRRKEVAKSPPSRLIVSVPGPWGDERVTIFPAFWLDSFNRLNDFADAEGKVIDWSPEYQQFVRLLRSKKPLPNPMAVDLLPPEIRSPLMASVAVAPWDKDVAITNFIEERMPSGRKRKGIPKALINKVKEKFGLTSKSAILRAFARGKKYIAQIQAGLMPYNPKR